MEYGISRHISSEKDLKLYEDYLKKDKAPIKQPTPLPQQSTPPCLTNPMFMVGYLKNHIGKLVKVECLVGGCMETKVGVLFDVGLDFINLKLYKTNCSMLIGLSTIKYITIVHDNDLNKTGLY